MAAGRKAADSGRPLCEKREAKLEPDISLSCSVAIPEIGKAKMEPDVIINFGTIPFCEKREAKSEPDVISHTVAIWCENGEQQQAALAQRRAQRG